MSIPLLIKAQTPSQGPHPHCCSVIKLCPTLCDPWTAARQASLSFTISQSLYKLMSIESVMPSNHIILRLPLLLLPQSFPPSGSFPVSRFFTSGHQRFGALTLESVLPVNIQDCFPLGLTGLITLLSKGLSRVFTLMAISKYDYLPNPHILTPLPLHWESGFQHMNLLVGGTSSP